MHPVVRHARRPPRSGTRRIADPGSACQGKRERHDSSRCTVGGDRLRRYRLDVARKHGRISANLPICSPTRDLVTQQLDPYFMNKHKECTTPVTAVWPCVRPSAAAIHSLHVRMYNIYVTRPSGAARCSAKSTSGCPRDTAPRCRGWRHCTADSPHDRAGTSASAARGPRRPG